VAVMISIGAMMLSYTLMRPLAAAYNAEKPFLRTISRSYFCSGFWSPAWGTVIIYSVHTDVEWVRVIPVGVAFSLLFVAMNLLPIYLSCKRDPEQYQPSAPPPGKTTDTRMVMAVPITIALMIGSIVVLNVTTGWDLMLVVTVVAVCFPLVSALVQRLTDAYKTQMGSYFRVSLPKVREQVILFSLAGFLGRALDISGVGLALAAMLPDWLRYTPPLMVAALVLIMMIPSFIGIHPTAMGTAMVTILEPAALGLSSYTFALAMLLGWVVANMVAPFSVVAMMLSGANGQSTFDNSLFLNWKFAVVSITVYSLLISVIGPMLG
jgi:hypothetical protein